MALWTPAEITTALWLDAADSGTITLDSGKATQWDDKSGNARHATPASAGTGAVPLSASINGLNTLSFDGTVDQRMVCNRPFPVVGSFFYVQKTTDATYVIFNSGGSLFSTVAQSGSTASVSGGYGTPVYYLDGNLQTWTTRDQVYLSLHNRVSVVEHIGCSLSGWSSLLGISNYTHVVAFLFNGEIGEIIGISEEIDLESRQKIEGYLAWKWGLEANLPVGHPYQDAAPTADTGVSVNIPAASLTLTTQAPAIRPFIVNIPAASLALTALAPTTEIFIVEGGSAATTHTLAAGAGQKAASGGASVTVETVAAGGGAKTAQGGSAVTVETVAAGGGRKNASGGSAVILHVVSSGAGTKQAQGGASATVLAFPSGAGRKDGKGGSSTSIHTLSTGTGRKDGEGGSSTSIHTLSTGTGRKDVRGGSVATVQTVSAGGGTANQLPRPIGKTSLAPIAERHSLAPIAERHSLEQEPA